MVAISYVPFLQDIFKTGPLTLADWGFLVVAARHFVLRRRSEKMVRCAAGLRAAREGEPDARDHRRLRPGRRLHGGRALPARGTASSSSTATRPRSGCCRTASAARRSSASASTATSSRRPASREADALVAVTSGDNTNIVAARVAKEVYRVPDVVSRIYDPQRAEIYRRYGIQTFAPTAWSAGKIVEFIVSPQLEREVALRQRRGAAHGRLGAGAPGRQAGQRPRRARRDPASALIVRMGKGMIPVSGTRFEEDDQVHVAGPPDRRSRSSRR